MATLANRQRGRGDHDLHKLLEMRHSRFLPIAVGRRLHDSSRRRVEPIARSARPSVWSDGTKDVALFGRRLIQHVLRRTVADIAALMLRPL